jgi:hypothetical protein
MAEYNEGGVPTHTHLREWPNYKVADYCSLAWSDRYTIVAMGVEDMENPTNWVVLGHYDPEEYKLGSYKWERFLQDEAVRLADEKGLDPKTTYLQVLVDAFSGSLLVGNGTGYWDQSGN